MCGIIGVWGRPDASHLCREGLFALNHRGEESAGIAASDTSGMHVVTGMGLVSDVFGDPAKLNSLPGSSAIGHTRYSTHGGCLIKNAQPLLVDCVHGQFAVAHNGNLVNAPSLRKDLEQSGAIFLTDTDTEVIPHLYARSKAADSTQALRDTLSRLRGAYSLVMLRGGELLAARDPVGWRPLSLGVLGSAYVIASETCAFDLIGAKYVRDIDAGEMLVINKHGLTSHAVGEQAEERPCIFEHIYFARPDSIVFGCAVNDVRKKLGQELARQQRISADIVVPVPDSGKYAADGYAQASGLPLVEALIRNHYIGRTFIQPQDRASKVRHKLSPVRNLLESRRVILVDDSLVRGTTAKEIVKMVRAAGATEVHLAIACPPTISSCYFGIDTPRTEELVVPTLGLDGAREFVGADSLTYLSIGGLMRVDGYRGGNCTACFTKDYPTALG